MPSFLGDLSIPDYFWFSGPVYSWLHQIIRDPFYAWLPLIMRTYYSWLLDAISLCWIFLITQHSHRFDYVWIFPNFSCAVEWVSLRLEGRIQRLLMTHYLGWVMGLSVKQTLRNLHWDRRFHALVRRVELHRFHFPASWRVSQSRLLNVKVFLLRRKQLLWCLRVEHGWLKVSRPELLFHERVRWPQNQKTRRQKCYQKRSHHVRNLRRSLLTTSQRWPGTLLKTKAVHWLTVTIRFVSSVFVLWLPTWRSWRRCTFRL